MICPQCHTSNPPENKFCRECGGALTSAVVTPNTTPVLAEAASVDAAPPVAFAYPVPSTEAEAPTLTPEALAGAMAAPAEPVTVISVPATERILQESPLLEERAAQLLAESAGLESRGWLVDATARAEKAAALLPNSNAPLSALVRLYEAQGDRDRALVMQGQIVRHNPELLAERQRYDRMQQEAARASVSPVAPASVAPRAPQTAKQKKDSAPPYLPLAIAGGVAALVFCVGVSLWGKRNNEPRITETTFPAYSAPLNAPAPPVSSAPSALGAGTDAALSARPSVPASQVNSDPFVRQRPSGFGSPSAPASGFTPPTRRSASGNNGSGTAPRSGPRPGTLPLPNLSAPGQVGGGPVRFVAPAPVTVEQAPAAAFGNGGRVPAKPPTESNSEPAPPASGTEGSEAPGYIHIQVRPGANPPPPQSPGVGGGTNDNSDTAAAMPNLSALERARELQDQGHYPEAIAAYREAIRLTPMPPAGVYQGLAQSYQRTGDLTAARSNYQVAIRSYEAEINAGQRSQVSVRGLATCRAALEVLGG